MWSFLPHLVFWSMAALASSSGAKGPLVEKCLELQRALVEMAEKMARAEARKSAAEDEVRALNEYVEVLMTKMSAVKTPGSSPPTKLLKPGAT